MGKYKSMGVSGDRGTGGGGRGRGRGKFRKTLNGNYMKQGGGDGGGGADDQKPQVRGVQGGGSSGRRTRRRAAESKQASDARGAPTRTLDPRPPLCRLAPPLARRAPQLAQQKRDDVSEAGLGWPLFEEGPDRLGWLLNFTTASHEDKDSGQAVSAVDCFFMCQVRLRRGTGCSAWRLGVIAAACERTRGVSMATAHTPAAGCAMP